MRWITRIMFLSGLYWI